MLAMATQKLTIRPMISSDREQVFAISAQIWDGDDYVPEVWDAWLADPQGRFVAATLRGRVTGFAMITRYGPGEWWMQGLRVDPKYRGRGIARALHDYLLAFAGQAGPGMVRYATGGNNLGSQHLGRTSGFEFVGRFLRLRAPALTRAESAALALPPLTPWRKGDLQDLERFLRRSPRLRADHGLYAAAWTWRELTPARLAAHVAAREVYGWRDAHGRVTALALLEQRSDEDQLRVSLADARLGGPLSLTHLGRALRDMARRRRRKAITLEVPVDSPWQHALEKAGYALAWDPGDCMVLLERPVP
jgi:ribosomal protein S18 acetylase RimI-like enzyme